MVEADDDTSIKIADFGFAKKVTKPYCLRTLCGTAQYVAPEVLDLQSGGYDHRADMWSVGVVVYILLGGYAPFEGPVQELARAICNADYCFHDKYWSDISDAAKGMISSLLEVDIERRLTAEAALQCPWMTVEEESLGANALTGAQEKLKEEQAQAQKLKEEQDRIAAKAAAAKAVNAVVEEEKLKQKEKKTVSKNDSISQYYSGLVDENDKAAVEQLKKRMEMRTMETVREDEKTVVGVIDDSSSGKPFARLYKLGRVIDEGDFDYDLPTYEARHKQSSEVFAVKRIERAGLHPLDAVALQDEISVLRMIAEAPHIIYLHDVFEEPDYTYMVCERLKGGPLIDRIIERRFYNERDARILIAGVLRGVEHCHNRRIAIRNLKTETLECVEKGNDVDVKITDFGFSKRVLYPNALQTQCGTEGYVAPEILEHRPAYDVQCDIWSLGVILYILLGGYRPFRGEGEAVMRLIRYGEFKFHKRYWTEVTEDAKILITRMLTVNPIARITATGALQSEWIQASEEALFSHGDGGSFFLAPVSFSRH